MKPPARPSQSPARAALSALRRDIEAAAPESNAAQTAAALHLRLPGAVAAVLREDGAARVAEYWRLYARLEGLRRDLAAFDQVMLADFPVIHPATGRPVPEFLAPERLSASRALAAATQASSGLPGVADFARAWRDAAAAL
jgi:hypothetical protein